MSMYEPSRGPAALARCLVTPMVSFALMFGLFGPPLAKAQVAEEGSGPVAPRSLPKVDDVQFGFKPLPKGAKTPTHKVGFWAPLSFKAMAEALPPGATPGKLSAPEGERQGAKSPQRNVFQVVAESLDNEDVTTHQPSFIAVEGGLGVHVTFLKPGRMQAPTRLSVQTETRARKEWGVVPPALTAGLDSSLYLCLGSRLEELPAALGYKEKSALEEGRLRHYVPTRFAIYEDQVDRLPTHWIGYQTVDLAILSTNNRAFLKDMIESNRVAPLRDWVARGGRLIVSLHPRTADLVSAMFPEIKVAADPILAKNLVAVESWAGLQNKPFPPRGDVAVPIVPFEGRMHDAWDIQAQMSTTAPGDRAVSLIARVPMRFGSMTFVAFPLDDLPFTRWQGQVEFLRNLVDQLGPRHVSFDRGSNKPWEAAVHEDLGADLHRALDNFDVPVIRFGYVALFIALYIAVVGPLDYFVLRRLVGKLEWTWLSFPLIVAATTFFAYLAYSGTSGLPLLVNKFDLVDYDLRGGAVQGTTFVACRSPAIQNRVVSVVPTMNGFAREVKNADRVDVKHDAIALSWFGPPDLGPAGMGRLASQGVSTRSYTFSPRLDAMERVPFADRSSRAFVAEWERPIATGDVPVEAKLTYHPRESFLKVSGHLVNRFPFALHDVCLFVFDRVYRLGGEFKAGESREVAIKEIDNGVLASEWRDKTDTDRPTTPQGVYDPGVSLRSLLFHERLDPQMQRQNHLFRRLDWSWRLRGDPRVVNVPLSSLGTREAVLFARVPFARGGRGDFGPEAGKVHAPTTFAGEDPATISQDTYLRFLVPLEPSP